MKATSLKLCKRMSIEQVFQAITVHCMAQIQANGAVLRKAHDVTGLHQMRVGVRRLRSALAAFKDVLRIPEEIHQELDWLAAPLGAARDWDVLTGSTLPAVVRELGDDIQAADVLLAVRERSNVMHAAVADRLLMEVRDERPDLGPDIEWIRKHLAPHIKGDDLKIRKELKKCASIKFLG